MSDIESFVRFCESDSGIAVMDRETASLRDHATYRVNVGKEHVADEEARQLERGRISVQQTNGR